MFKIRRPLCPVGLAYVAAVVTVIALTARPSPTYEELDREQITVAGYVEHIEYKQSRGSTVPVISLSETAVLKESQKAILERFLSDSEKISQYRLHQFWKDNRESLQREGAEGLEGVLCYMEEEKIPKMGSLVVMQGDYRAFSHATNPGEFDSADYYRIMGQQGRVMDCRMLVQSAAYDVFGDKMYHIREYLSLLTDACFAEEDVSVIKAMLLGEKGSLSVDLKELYQQNGIIHILAISGLHLSVIGMGCYRLLKKVRAPNTVNIILTIGIMYCYGTMTGMGVSMLRAYIMFGIHMCAKLIGRTYDLLTAMTVAALVVLVQQPLYIQHSGFLFSFGAICGIGIFLPAAEQNLFGHSRLEKALMSGIAISMSTLPVYLCFYYEFPPYSVLLNLIVIPCMTFVLVGGLITLGAAVCFLPLGTVAAYPVHLLLIFYEKCCNICLRLPDSKWITGNPKPWQVAVFLGILLGLVIWNHKLSKLCFRQGMLCALLVLSIKLPQGLQITMLDVGQGDCIYLAEDSGIHMLIDGGSSDKSDVAKYQIMPYLKYEGVSYLDAVVVTHPDSDHISGICVMLEEMDTSGIAVGTLYLPDVGETGRNEEYRELERLAQAADVSVRYLGVGDTLKCGEVMLTCLHPEKGWDEKEANAYSTVLYLEYGSFTALFTGDLEGEGEKLVVERLDDFLPAQGITLLKVAHHGSRNSTDEAFLKAVNPQLALISAGRNNRYGHPHEELLERLTDRDCLTYRTQESGAITVRVRSGKVWVEEYVK